VYGVLPFNWYTTNYGSVLADAYFVGKILYPERFEDVRPAEKADEIYEFLVGKPVFEKMNELFEKLAFKRIELDAYDAKR
jgi:iron complex transport system substrate-binding protein